MEISTEVLAQAHEFYEKGLAAQEAQDLQGAFDNLMKAVELNPLSPPYRMNLAVMANRIALATDHLRELAYQQGVEACRQASHVLGNWILLGDIALSALKYPEAIAAYERALSIDDKVVKLWTILGFCHLRINEIPKAKLCYEKALEINPEFGHAHFLLSVLYAGIYYNPEKQAFHGEKGFTSKHPTNMDVDSCWNAAHGYLAMGNYEKGWKYFTARLNRNTQNAGHKLLVKRYQKPVWKGENNCRLLVTAEMGLGDSFIMARYFEMIENKVGISLVFECHKQMLALMRYNLTYVKCIEYGTVTEDDFDYHIPMMSLPLICETKSDSVPWTDGGYIKADQSKIDEWRNWDGFATDGRLNIGLCWSGGSRAYNAANHETDKRRSLPLRQFQGALKGVHANFIALQPEGDSGPYKKPSIKDFSDTAAIIHLLDAVVSVDTSVINLAGAMGKRAWLLNRYDSCWRWSRHLKTPWYPTVREIRQEEPGDWSSVLSIINYELKDVVVECTAKVNSNATGTQ